MLDRDADASRFNRRFALHQQGKLADAERAYQEVLRRQPDHCNALHLLGVITLQTRGAEAGVELIRKAIAHKPNVAAAHINLGVAPKNLKRPEEALASYDRAIRPKPNCADAHNNRSVALRALRRVAESLAGCDRAIALSPGHTC